ncbi:RNA pseudouridine synthase 1 [Amaranthus tricolor]|uniref:RNA pseudouridine synthase 1 n=1 Tax=Amaranthus tricolor TaxID=29722 RepID=UPI002587C17E|nr:RNA pseudouridine synthase 1 [Amaranthus tricolor]
MIPYRKLDLRIRKYTKFLHPLKSTILKLLTSPSFLQSIPQVSMSSISSHHSDSSSMDKSPGSHLPNDTKPFSLSSYPTPLSPPLPLISKQIELNRAMDASSRSSLYSLSRENVIFEDQWLIVVNKPSGIYCESVLSSVPQFLQHSADSVEASEFHLANRLDRDTSGVMVITKSHKVASKLVKAFTDHKVQKTYVALCVGSAPEWDKIRLKSGHGRSKYGAWRVYAASDVGQTLPGGSVVKDMETLFELLSLNRVVQHKGSLDYKTDVERTVVIQEKSLADATQRRDEILVRAFPKSGRTHQIRLHCQYLGIPIKGDVKYEGVNEWKGEICNAHNLHAESLSLEHPVTGLPVQFRAALPQWAIKAMQ